MRLVVRVTLFPEGKIRASMFSLAFPVALVQSKKSEKKPDPRECEVCIANLEAIDALIPASEKKSKDAVEKAITKHCTLSGFGSDWKPNPKLTKAQDVKMCYIFDPIKKSISQPFSTRMPKMKVCQRLKKDNPDICETKYPLKVEKKEGQAVDYNSLKVKDLKTILSQRGTSCQGCTEKAEFVKKCQATEHLDI